MVKINDIKFDCRYFKGDVPCRPNKENDVQCDNCTVYSPISKSILIIKLGAIGDVIRTTPLAVKYRRLYPDCHITWLTHSPAVVPVGMDESGIDVVLPFKFEHLYGILHKKFDIAINLDKETEACALLADVSATEKYGYIWDKENSHLAPATATAAHKLLTGCFDRLSKENTKHYLDEIFEICHLKFADEPYLIAFDKTLVEKFNYIKEMAKDKKIIGLNTGCGGRWTTRLWAVECWQQLINLLKENDYFPLLLGGENEDTQNQALAKETKAFYAGHFSLAEFIALTSICDAVVTQVSMMMHIATALQKPLILMNNIFNSNEFYLYDRGKIIEPTTGCDCFYGAKCKRQRHCMLDISPQTIYQAINEQV